MTADGTFDVDLACAVAQVACFAADGEAARRGPGSQVPLPPGYPVPPDGAPESPAAQRARIVSSAVWHLLEQGLVTLAPSARERLATGFRPTRRAGPPTGVIEPARASGADR
jgi:hypothetical protein